MSKWLVLTLPASLMLVNSLLGSSIESQPTGGGVTFKNSENLMPGHSGQSYTKVSCGFASEVFW